MRGGAACCFPLAQLQKVLDDCKAYASALAALPVCTLERPERMQGRSNRARKGFKG